MSVAVDFEETLLQLLKDNQKAKENKIKVKNDEKKENNNNSPKCNHKNYNDDFHKQEFTIAPAVSLFAGICIGVGLASHSLIIQWK